MSEEVKRLTPTANTLRELYLRSGNQCAFEGCIQPIIDNEGNYIAELCHIEAAQKGGERFNPKQTNEERRSYSNLLFLCHTHHIVTNDVEKYTVEKMREIKKAHESKYSDITKKIQQAFIDYSGAFELKKPQSLNRINTVLNWGLTEDELEINKNIIIKFITGIQSLPPATRQLLLIIVSRATEIDMYGLYVPAEEIRSACQINRENLKEQIRILEKYNIAYLDQTFDEIYIIRLMKYDGWEIWSDIKKFIEATGIPLSDLIIDLKFNLLD